MRVYFLSESDDVVDIVATGFFTRIVCHSGKSDILRPRGQAFKSGLRKKKEVYIAVNKVKKSNSNFLGLGVLCIVCDLYFVCINTTFEKISSHRNK